MEGGIDFGGEEGDCRLQYPLSKYNSKPLKQGNRNDLGCTTTNDRRGKDLEDCNGSNYMWEKRARGMLTMWK